MFFVSFKSSRFNFDIEVANQFYDYLKDEEDEEAAENFPYENRARVVFSMGYGPIKGGLSYLDSNYANQQQIDADTIARYSLFGSFTAFMFEVGAFVSYGADTQSLEELNNEINLFQIGGNFKMDL